MQDDGGLIAGLAQPTRASCNVCFSFTGITPRHQERGVVINTDRIYVCDGVHVKNHALQLALFLFTFV